MAGQPRIIVLCRAYNAEDYVEETIWSVLNQTYDNFVFVIFENGSTDGTRGLIKKYIEDPRFVYLESDYNDVLEPMKAHFADWREIVKPTTEDYVTTLDSDDCLEKNGLQRMAQAAKKYNANIVFAGCNMFYDGNPNQKFVRKPSKNLFYDDIRDSAMDWISMYGSIRVIWGNLYKYHLWEKASPMAKAYAMPNGADTLQNILTMGMADNLATISEAVINYRIRKKSVYHTRLVPDRYMAYDYIRNESVKLLQKWGCKDVRTYYFVEQCRESSMYDLVQNLTGSRENYKNNCQLLYNIFTDEGFADGLERYNLKDSFFQKTVETVQKNDEMLTECRYENFVMTMLYGIIKNNLWLYLAGLYSDENVCQWGASHIEKELLPLDSWIAKIFDAADWKKVFQDDRKCIVLMLEKNYVEAARQMDTVNEDVLHKYKTKDWIKRAKSLNELKKMIADALDNGRNADKLFRKALHDKPLDKDILKYLLLYDIGRGNQGRLMDISIMIRYVYSNDPGMLYMAALAFEYMNMPENAVECLEIAVKATDDLARQEEYQAEIVRLKELI